MALVGLAALAHEGPLGPPQQGRPRPGDGTTRTSAQPPPHQALRGGAINGAGQPDDQVGRLVDPLPEAAHDRPRHAGQRGLRAGDGPAQRMVRPQRLQQEVLGPVRRLVAIHDNLFRDNLPFPLQIIGGEARLGEHLDQNIQHLGLALRRHPRVVAGGILLRIGVRRAPAALHRFRNGPRGAPAGPLEQQVLDEMADPIQRRRLVPRAHRQPGAE